MKDSFHSISKTFYYLVITLFHLFISVAQRREIPNVSFINRLLFLTNISFNINWFYYLTRFLKGTPVFNSVSNLIEENSLKRLFRFSFSLSFVILILYWGMKLADPKLLFKSGKVIPLYLDLILHGGNFVLNFVEHSFLQSRNNYENSYKSFFVFMIFYACLLKISYQVFGIITYPFVYEQNILFFGLVVLCGMVMMLLGDLMFKGIEKVNTKRLKIKAGE